MAFQTVYFTGTLPLRGEAPVGGGEVGNLRTVRMLESFGYKVNVIRRLRSNAKDSKFKKILSYPLRFVRNIVSLFFVLLLGKRKGNVVHISGFAGVTIFIETVQMGLAKMFGYKTIYELRGGGIVGFYENGSKWYKKQFRYLVKKADYVFSQGQENEYLLKSLNVTNIFYYPNCVLDGFYPKELKPKPSDKINLLFYGRIEAEKNPLMIVEIARILQEKYNNITLTMIGNGQGELLKEVRRSMENSLQEESFVLLPGFKHEDLPSILLDKHFYIFPSTQPREGQSNSVTECMSYGIVPIASPQGFNRSTIGDDKLIIDELKAESYARRIIEIIQANRYHHYSQMVYERFQNNFTQKVVFERTLKLYREILEKKDK